MKLDPVTQKLLELKWHSPSAKKELEDQIEDSVQKTKDTIKNSSIFSPIKGYKDSTEAMGKAYELAKKRAQMDKDNEESEGVAKAVGTVIAVGAVVAAAVHIGNKVYKQYFSKAAQACKHRPDKGLCMKQFQNKAVEVEISQLQKAKAYCKKSTNPKQCISKLDQEIQKNKAKLNNK
jgi:hypothetical protein